MTYVIIVYMHEYGTINNYPGNNNKRAIKSVSLSLAITCGGAKDFKILSMKILTFIFEEDQTIHMFHE